MDNVMNTDLYGLLEISPSATLKEIRTAYRKKALSCHPDKNPDNPRAAQLFHELSRVLEILTDSSARAAYDKVLASKAQAQIRAQKLNEKRKKFKDDLEAREEHFRKTGGIKNKSDEEKLKEEIERLQKEGSKLVEEEINFVSKKIAEEFAEDRRNFDRNPRNFADKAHTSMTNRHDDENTKVKLKWKCQEDDIYNYNVLHRILSKYGDISALIVSSNKKGSALVEFKERSAAEMAVQIERGLVQSPLNLVALWKTEKPEKKVSASASSSINSQVFPGIFTGRTLKNNGFPSFSSAPDIFTDPNTKSDVDFEKTVLSNMRKAEERKRLIEQITEEEKNQENG